MSKPEVSIILPVYNAEKFIVETIESILSQFFTNFELIIIDDCSEDNSLRLVKRFVDKRIHIYRNKKNLGVAKTLNIGLSKALGKFIARCDADDINLQDRFLRQIQFLKKNKNYVLVGSNAEIFFEDKQYTYLTKMPLSHKQIQRRILIKNPFIHSTVMFRKEAIIKAGSYNALFNGAEDYELWLRMIQIGKVKNLKKALVKRRIHKNVITKKDHFKVELLALLVRMKYCLSVLKVC